MSKPVRVFVGVAAMAAMAAAVLVALYRPASDSASMGARFGVPSARAAEPVGHIGEGKSAAAVEKAGQEGKYVYALFYREQNDQTSQARQTVESARKKLSRKSQFVEINASDPAEQDIVNKFGTGRAPMPLVLVLAPNGAVMGGYPGSQLDENTLINAVGSRASEQTLKALQQRNLVALCVQNRKTADNEAALRGVEEFVKDPKFAQNTAVVTVDPSDPAEARFLSQLNVDANTGAATTVLLAPPGSIIGTFKGALKKDQLAAAVQAAAAPRSGGCCPAGSGKTCGPTGGTAAAPQRAPTTAQPQSAQTKMQITKIPPPSATAPATKNQGK